MADDVTSSLSNLQVIEVSVNGPGRARRLFLVSGQMPVSVFANANAGQSASNRRVAFARIGPTLTSEQFVRAAASAAPSQWQTSGALGSSQISIDDTDADFDDESGQVAIEIEASATLNAQPAGSANIGLTRVAFTAQILATE